MCGIVGWAGSQKPFSIESFGLALDTLSHRGPDHGDYIEIPDRVVLGHRRLSIVDLDARANQPMKSRCGRFYLVFNGEIFNHPSLRKRLSQQGVAFQTSSDTEVLLEGLALYGEAFIQELNGFFSFALYDAELNELLLVRDRFGIKPLYFHTSGSGLFFGSELKPLKKLGIPFNIDINVLQEYLLFTYVPEPLSMVEGVRRLLPGHLLRFSSKQGVDIYPYYSIESAIQPRGLSFAQAAERCKEKIQESVGLRMVADVPVGSFLSGGIDSSVIASVAQKLHGGIQTYSVGFSDNKFFDETQQASQTAEKLGCRHHNIILKNRVVEDCLDDFFDVMDEPFADSSAINVFHLCRAVRNNITVALSGDGADEVFAGYNKHRALQMSLIRHYRVLLPMIRPIINRYSSNRNSVLGNKVRQLQRLATGIGKSTVDRYVYWGTFSNRQDVIRCLKKNNLSEKPSFTTYLPNEISDLNGFLLCDQRVVLPGDMLTKVDRMSMASSLEVRVPFLDHNIVDFVNSLPGSYKLNHGTTKRLLREAFRGELPDEVFQRPKRGFEIPLEGWVTTIFDTKIEQYIRRDYLNNQGLFDYAGVLNIFETNRKNPNPEKSATLYSFLVFQEWWTRINSNE